MRAGSGWILLGIALAAAALLWFVARRRSRSHRERMRGHGDYRKKR